MLTSGALKKKFEEAFDKKQATVLTEVITASYNDLVKTGDFNELKEIVMDIGIKVGELAEAQKGSEKRLTRIETVVEELAEAQKRTEVSVADLSEEVTQYSRYFSKIQLSDNAVSVVDYRRTLLGDLF